MFPISLLFFGFHSHRNFGTTYSLTPHILFPLLFCVARFLPTLGVLFRPEKESEKDEKLQGRRQSHGETLLRDLKGIFTQPWEMGSPTEGNRESLKDVGVWTENMGGDCSVFLFWGGPQFLYFDVLEQGEHHLYFKE